MNYENRVTVYIDILGFKDILSKTVDNDGEDITENIDKIISAYGAIRDVWDLDDTSKLNKLPSKSKKVTTFSDCLVISFKTNEESEIFHTLVEIQWMLMRLITRGILCRGAITYGKLIHTDEFLFGPALAEAYILESKAALYPRIILHEDLIEFAGNTNRFHKDSEMEKEYIKKILEKDSDGMYFIDYFASAESELDSHYDFPEYLDIIGTIVREGLEKSDNIFKSDIKVKYQWMKERYNNIVDAAQKKKFIKRLKKNGEQELADAFLELKRIN